MKLLHYLLGILSAFCLIFILLITSVEAVVYWTPGYFEKEYEKYQVLDNLPAMTMEDLLEVTDEMMDFSVETGKTYTSPPHWTDSSGSFSMSGKSPTWRMCATFLSRQSFFGESALGSSSSP